MSERLRPIQMKFYVTEEERDFIHNKMALMNITNQSAYLRKMTVDGMLVQVDYSNLDKVVNDIIIANSVSFENGNKFLSRRSTMYEIRKISDELCRENGLSVIAEPKEKGRSQYERSLEKNGQSWKALLQKNIDSAILNAKDFDEFLKIMETQHYEIKRGKYISFRAEGQERFTRGKTLGYDYTEERLREKVAGKGKSQTVSLNH